jgi:hypothetical protein
MGKRARTASGAPLTTVMDLTDQEVALVLRRAAELDLSVDGAGSRSRRGPGVGVGGGCRAVPPVGADGAGRAADASAAGVDRDRPRPADPGPADARRPPRRSRFRGRREPGGVRTRPGVVPAAPRPRGPGDVDPARRRGVERFATHSTARSASGCPCRRCAGSTWP